MVSVDMHPVTPLSSLDVANVETSLMTVAVSDLWPQGDGASVEENMERFAVDLAVRCFHCAVLEKKTRFL